MLPGNVDFIGRMYAFGAMLSFTIAHASVIQLRRQAAAGRGAVPRAAERARSAASTGRSSRVFGGLGTGARLARRRRAGRADALRRARLARGRVRLLRRLPAPARRRRCARPCVRRSSSGRRSRSSTATILVPIVSGPESHEAIDLAARLAAERGATIVALRVIVVPLDLPLDAELRERGGGGRPPARRRARRSVELYGVRMIDRLVRARNAGRAIVDEAERRQAEIVVLGAPRGRHRDDLRQDRRLRPQERPVPRDGRRRQEGRVTRALTGLLRPCGLAQLDGRGSCMSRTHASPAAPRSRSASASRSSRTLARRPGRLGILLGARSSSPPAPGGSTCRGGEALDGPQAARPPPRARRALALLGRLRRDRLVDLLRARRRSRCTRSASRRSCCSASGCSSCSSRSPTPRRPRRCPRPAAPPRSCAARSNDLAGFMTGWALFLDYLIVIALSALFVPHYLAAALQVERARAQPVGRRRRRRRRSSSSPAIRLVRRPSLYALGIVVPALDLLTQLVLVVFGFALLFSPHALTHGTSLGHAPTVALARLRACRSRCSRTPASRPSRTSPRRRAGPGVDLPRSLFVAIGTVVTVYVAIAVVALSAFPGPDTAARHRAGCARRSSASPTQIRGQVPHPARRHDPLLRRRERRADPARVGDDLDLGLLAPRLLARRARPAAARLRAAAPPHARLAAGDRQRGGDLERDRDRDGVHQARRRVPRERVLVRRAARVHGGAARGDQAADHRARPAAALPRAAQRHDPRRARSRSRRSSARSSPSRSGSLALATHPGARYAGPAWLAVGLVVFVARSPLARRGADRARHRARRACASTTCRTSGGSSCR